ncbi:acyl-CoA dehydrogenase family protein [Streptomyces sp. ME18-1-4]|jgi:L-prolyl-[peptidyl-carrier protein] dehydrogenase|uniref:acyl-CoA dehydrogenase family protein n=1 Tax=Streptomyces sp. ME18-1-4 TaxID=3028685 RepID=UPI0029B29E62|nr:acyl-CoA dehydrogenase family protein [Streptomyces sp. ME18-1-4]MDX3240502.1 acyl-CoA dehydrogenase family protein [Streptomyces sp. ME18-1-4]
MDFELSPIQRERCAGIGAAVAERFAEHVTSADPELVRLAWKDAAGVGLTGLCLSEQHGGAGLGALDTALGLEAFGRSCSDMGLVFGVAAHLLSCAVPVREFGTDEAARELLAGMAAGDLIAGNAMTEDEAGSDIGRIRTTATRTGEGYVLAGEKSFVSNAPVADVFVTYAVTDPSAGFLGVSAFAVPRELDGVVVGPPLRKMGLNGCLAARVRFEDCVVPARYLLGAEGSGGAIFQHSMAWERGCLFAAYLGLMERQLAECVGRTTRRRQFGRKISGFQAVSHRIARMRQRLESARLLLYRACWLLDQGRTDVTAIAMAKTAVSEAAVANSLDAMQLFGSAGYLADTGIEEQLRDCLPTTVFSGTTEIQLELIAREAGL